MQALGDRRYTRILERLQRSDDWTGTLQRLNDEEIVQALAAVSLGEERDAYLANVLATEAMNRVHRSGTITRAAAEALVSLDATGRITHANPATHDILHADAGALVGEHYHQHLNLVGTDGQPVPRERCPIQHALATGQPLLGLEVRLQRMGGEIFPALVSVAPVERGGLHEGVVLAFTDITQRKRAEEQVKRERARLYAILDNLTEGVLLLDGDGRFEFVNRAAERILGHARGRLVGLRLPQRPYQMLEMDGTPIHPEAGPLVQALRTQSPVRDFRCLIERPDGTRVPVEADAVPILEGDELRGVAVSFDDITQRLRAERRLEEELKRQQSLFDLFPDPIFTLAVDGTIQAANAAAEAATGYATAEVVGTHFAPLIHPDDLPVAIDAQQAVADGERKRTSLRILHKDGHYLPFDVMGVPLIVDGRIVGSYGIAKPG